MILDKRYERGVIAGNFDVMHPGYIKMFKEAGNLCERFIVLLHTDPSIERPHKLKPVLSTLERIEMLESIKYITDVHVYTYESELEELLKGIDPDIRFLGDDYKGRNDFTGYDLNIPIHYFKRDHGWSTTKFKKLIAKTI
jgi:glycerol-3-phosphate cytidylyltransferase